MHIAASHVSSGRSTIQLKATRCPLPAVTALSRGRCRHLHVHAAAQKQGGKKQSAEPGAGLKAIWRAADQYSSFFGKSGEKPSVERKKNISRKDALASIRKDFENNYFVSGNGSMEAYDPDCLFRDDFASFSGLEKFQRNVRSLGDFTEDVQLSVSSWDEREGALKAGWRFSALLTLPWRPRLAAAGATTYVFDKQTGLVVEHIEEWAIEPKKVMQQLLLPANRSKEQTTWERFMDALGRGRLAAAWGVISGRAFIAAAAVLGFCSAIGAVTDDTFPPEWLSLTMYLVLFAAVASAGGKLVKREE